MQMHLGIKQSISLNEALGRYWLEYAQFLKSGNKAIKYHCEHILNYIGRGTMLIDISDDMISRMKATLRTKMGDSTVNRVLSTLRKLLNKARHEWDYSVADLSFKKHMLIEPEARTRWITTKEADLLIEKAAQHLKAPLRFALLTGVRLTNITNLKWEDIDFYSGVIRFSIKSNIPGGKSLELPMVKELRDLLMQQKPQTSGYVFLRYFSEKSGRKPEPVKKFRRSFKHACKEAGITNFRFHDLRHTAASWMIQKGVPIDLVQDLLGHTQIETTKKYAHRDNAEKRTALETLATSQIRHTKQKRRLA